MSGAGGSAGWWHRASQAQKLAQLDGGIELGMTARQIGLASGYREVKRFGDAIRSFAYKHRRSLPSENDDGRFNQRRVKRLSDRRKAYWQGGRDFASSSIEPAHQPDLAELEF